MNYCEFGVRGVSSYAFVSDVDHWCPYQLHHGYGTCLREKV